jgi:hypothetical protein
MILSASGGVKMTSQSADYVPRNGELFETKRWDEQRKQLVSYIFLNEVHHMKFILKPGRVAESNNHHKGAG